MARYDNLSLSTVAYFMQGTFDVDLDGVLNKLDARPGWVEQAQLDASDKDIDDLLSEIDEMGEPMPTTTEVVEVDSIDSVLTTEGYIRAVCK